VVTPRYVFLDFTLVLTLPGVIKEAGIDIMQASSVVSAALAEALEIDPDYVTADHIYLATENEVQSYHREGRQLTGSSSNLYADLTVTLKVLQSDVVASGGTLKDAATGLFTTASGELSTSYASGHLSQLIQAYATSGSVLSNAQVDKALSSTPSKLQYGYTADRSQALNAQPPSSVSKKGTPVVSIVLGVFLSIAAISAIFGLSAYVYHKRPPLCVRMLHDAGILTSQS